MRQKFEENRHIKDPIKAREVLKQAEEKFEYIRNPDTIRCKVLLFLKFFKLFRLW